MSVDMRTDLRRVFRHFRTVAKWLILLLIVLYFASGFYSVKPEQRGVLKRCGRVVTDDMPPGIHYHLPWPVESVMRLRTTEIRSMPVRFGEADGPQEGKAAEGSTPGQVEASQEEKLVECPHVEETGPVLTADENLVLATLLIQYTINKPKNYLYSAIDADGLLKRIVQHATIAQVGSMSVDDVFTTGRLKMQTTLKEEIQEKVDAYHLGIRITSVQIQKIGPPRDVARSFRDVASAREDRHRIVQQAEGDRNRRIPKARADGDRIKSEAEAYAKEAVDRARGDAQRFISAWEEYRKAKNVTGYRLYVETLEEILSKVTKLISNPGPGHPVPIRKTGLSPDLAPPEE